MIPEVVPPVFQPEPWTAHAACRGMAVNLWFPTRGESATLAKAVCRDCEVREECLAFAMRGPERFGIFGGLSERERRRLRVGLAAVRPIDHGTTAGYAMHHRRGVAPCPACLDAHARHKQATRQTRAAL